MQADAIKPAILTTGIGALVAITLVAITLALVPAHEQRTARVELPAPEVPEMSYALGAQVTPTPMRQLMLVFSVAGTSYVKLGTELPRHGKPRLVEDDGLHVALAAVADQDVPAVHRHWLHHKMRVDNTCEANVIGFAIVARVAGDDDAPWTARSVLGHGGAMLAAKLDGCTGTFARDAALPDVTILHGADAPARLRARARQLVIASAASRDVQRTWLENYGERGRWYDAPETTFTTRLLHNPSSGRTWISVHAYNEEACGDPGANLWGLFRVRDDGTLETEQLHAIELTELSYIVDPDDRGELQLIGPSWLATSIVRASGDALESLVIQFFGCAC